MAKGAKKDVSAKKSAGRKGDSSKKGAKRAKGDGARQAQRAAKLRTVKFRFEGAELGHVAVTGDFNGWDPAGTPLRRRSGGKHDGRWSLDLELAPGRYEYRYIVEGRWVDAAGVRGKHVSSGGTAPNPFGGVNQVLLVS